MAELYKVVKAGDLVATRHILQQQKFAQANENEPSSTQLSLIDFSKRNPLLSKNEEAFNILLRLIINYRCNDAELADFIAWFAKEYSDWFHKSVQVTLFDSQFLSYWGFNSLHLAAYTGKWQVCKTLIEIFLAHHALEPLLQATVIAPINPCHGMNFLHLSVYSLQSSAENLILYLKEKQLRWLEKLAHIPVSSDNLGDQASYKPLHLAAQQGNIRACLTLLRAIPELANDLLKNLHITADGFNFLQLLLTNNISKSHEIIQVIQSLQQEFPDLFTELTTDVVHTEKDNSFLGYDALQLAAAYGNTEVCIALLEHNLDLAKTKLNNPKNAYDGCNFLHILLASKAAPDEAIVDLIDYLHVKNIHLLNSLINEVIHTDNEKSFPGYTALLLAGRYGRTQTCKKLLQYNEALIRQVVNCNKSNDHNFNFFSLLLSYSHCTDITLAAFIEYLHKETPDLCKELIDIFNQTNRQSDHLPTANPLVGFTPLLVAAFNNHVESCISLLEFDPNMAQETVANSNHHLNSEYNDLNFLQILLTNKSDNEEAVLKLITYLKEKQPAFYEAFTKSFIASTNEMLSGYSALMLAALRAKTKVCIQLLEDSPILGDYLLDDTDNLKTDYNFLHIMLTEAYGPDKASATMITYLANKRPVLFDQLIKLSIPRDIEHENLENNEAIGISVLSLAAQYSKLTTLIELLKARPEIARQKAWSPDNEYHYGLNFLQILAITPFRYCPPGTFEAMLNYLQTNDIALLKELALQPLPMDHEDYPGFRLLEILGKSDRSTLKAEEFIRLLKALPELLSYKDYVNIEYDDYRSLNLLGFIFYSNFTDETSIQLIRWLKTEQPNQFDNLLREFIQALGTEVVSDRTYTYLLLAIYSYGNPHTIDFHLRLLVLFNKSFESLIDPFTNNEYLEYSLFRLPELDALEEIPNYQLDDILKNMKQKRATLCLEKITETCSRYSALYYFSTLPDDLKILMISSELKKIPIFLLMKEQYLNEFIKETLKQIANKPTEKVAVLIFVRWLHEQHLQAKDFSTMPKEQCKDIILFITGQLTKYKFHCLLQNPLSLRSLINKIASNPNLNKRAMKESMNNVVIEALNSWQIEFDNPTEQQQKIAQNFAESVVKLFKENYPTFKFYDYKRGLADLTQRVYNACLAIKDESFWHLLNEDKQFSKQLAKNIASKPSNFNSPAISSLVTDLISSPIRLKRNRDEFEEEITQEMHVKKRHKSTTS